MTDAGPSARQRFLGPVERALPPVRLLLIALAILGGVSCYTLGGLGLSSLLFLPLVAGAVDLLFQSVRFERLRVPETAFASSLILALLLPPTVPLGPAAAIAVAAVGSATPIRRRGRPVFNPAADRGPPRRPRLRDGTGLVGQRLPHPGAPPGGPRDHRRPPRPRHLAVDRCLLSPVRGHRLPAPRVHRRLGVGPGPAPRRDRSVGRVLRILHGRRTPHGSARPR